MQSQLYQNDFYGLIGGAVGLFLAFVVPAACREQPLVGLLLVGGQAQASPRCDSVHIHVSSYFLISVHFDVGFPGYDTVASLQESDRRLPVHVHAHACILKLSVKGTSAVGSQIPHVPICNEIFHVTHKATSTIPEMFRQSQQPVVHFCVEFRILSLNMSEDHIPAPRLSTHQFLPCLALVQLHALSGLACEMAVSCAVVVYDSAIIQFVWSTR